MNGRNQSEGRVDMRHDMTELSVINRDEDDSGVEEACLAQEKTAQNEKMHQLEQMTEGTIHDFGNLLVPIIGLSEYLFKTPSALDDKEDALDILKHIVTAARDAGQYVARLRSFSKLKEKRIFSPTDMNKVIKESVSMILLGWKEKISSDGKNIRIITELEEIPLAAGYEYELRELLINLFLNAIDAMPQGGVITVRSMQDGNGILVEVVDSGVGMTEEVRKRCLDPFFSTKKKKGGTGLGLYMAQTIIERHNGGMNIVSSPGQGTNIRIYLPAATAFSAPFKALDDDDNAEDFLAECHA